MSCEVLKDSFLIFKYPKWLVISDKHLYWLDKKKKDLKKKDKLEDLQGMTLSLIRDQTNFVIHFSNRADEELFCSQ